jgi:hypothetical protein
MTTFRFVFVRVTLWMVLLIPAIEMIHELTPNEANKITDALLLICTN